MSTPRDGPSATILYAEDNPVSRSALAQILRDQGYHVREAATGREARRLADEGPDLILLDIQLPDANGFDLCRRFKAGSAASPPVLLISGRHVETEDRVRGLEGGADAYLTKPVEPAEILAQIRALLRARQAEELQLLRHSREQYRALAECIPQMVWVTGPDGCAEYFNRQWVKYAGLRPREASGWDWQRVIHPDDLAATLERWAAARQDGRPCEVEHRLRRADGEYRWHAGRTLPLRDRQGRVVAWFGACTDIDEQKSVEEGLHQERELLRGVLDSIQEAVVACDSEGNVTLVNQAAQEAAGPVPAPLSVPECTQPFSVFHPDGKTPMRREDIPLFRALQGEHVRGVEMVLIPSQGEKRILLASGQPLTDDDGNKMGAVVTLHDVTDRRRLEEQFNQSQKMEAVGQLTGGVAHDFNNLLCVIQGYGDMLLGTLPADDPARELVGEMTKAGERAAALTRQLLAFSRKHVPAPEVLDLNAVVSDLEKMLRRVIGEDVSLTTTLPEDLGRVRADPGQIEQVLLNLAVNARDAMPQGGRLTIETRNAELDEEYVRTHPEVRPGPHVLLAVSDTGCGMTEEVQARIFEPFFTTKEKGKGTGLGLSTVYAIVRQSGGHVAVHSEPGVGTTLNVYLPRVEEPASPATSPSSPAAAPCGTETVLLVEDDEAVRAFGRTVLQGCAYTVLEASGGDEAVRVAGQHTGPIHLLVSDVVMPGLSGAKLAEKLQDSHPEMKVLFLSGYADEEVSRHGVSRETVPFLQKPFLPAALAQKVREVLDAPA